MPSRNQGQRGTCASFAGIGQIEGYILKHSTLDSIDLSEQRFYAMSKPEHWDNGGDVNSGGSNSGDGFVKSFYDYGSKDIKYGDVQSPDLYNISSSFNIPLETKCPYVSTKVDNDIQSPGSKSGGCATGVAQVKDFNAWFYNWDEQVDTAQDIYDFIKDKDYPVIVFTRLSDNWEYNDGIITWADAQGSGSTSHAAGHAYLVVGMKKLSEQEFPNEGGMCFYIKNSWGKGWGVNGLSCMTLAWFNNHRFQTAFPSVLSVQIDEETLGTQLAEIDEVPSEIEEPDEKTKTIDENKTVRPRGKISFSFDNRYLISASDYTFGKVISNEDEFFKVLYRIDQGYFYLRGILEGESKQTHDLKLNIADNILKASFEGAGSVDVGALDPDKKEVTLCSQAYSEKCHFRYLEESNEITLSLTEAEFNRDDSEGPYDWTYLGAEGKGIELSFPEDFSTKIDVRFSKDGVETNPLRFRIKPIDGDILYQGQSVGDYQKGELCSGSFQDFCRVVRTEDKFLITFKSKKG